jgi:predicted nucleotidyltransferase
VNAYPIASGLGQDVREILERVVHVAQPDKIILFGSAARGDARPDSDIDLLVIKEGVHRRKLAQEIYADLLGVRRAVDVVVATPGDIEEYGTCPALVFESALREGTVVYAA